MDERSFTLIPELFGVQRFRLIAKDVIAANENLGFKKSSRF